MKSMSVLFRFSVSFAGMVGLHNAEEDRCRKWAHPLLFFLDPPTGLPSLPFRVYPITTQMHGSCQFLSCRFKNFSPETLVTFLLLLFSHQIIYMPSLRFFVSPRKRVIHTWTTKHPITSVIQNGSTILPVLLWDCRWSPILSAYLKTSWKQVSTEIYCPDCHFSCVLLVVFRILALRISQHSMRGECQGAILPFGVQRMCRSRQNLCSCPFMVRASTFSLNIVWNLCAFTKKSLLVVFFFSFCGIFLQPKRVWKEKGHLGRLCCGDQARCGSKEKIWYTDAYRDGHDGSVHTQTDWFMSFVWSPTSFLAYP